MRRSDLAELAAFVQVAEQLSFRAAAARLGVTPSALSHTIRQLEDRLDVRLLHRTTRSVSLTDAGQRLLEKLRPAIEQIGVALEDVNQERQRPFGRLRISAMHNLVATVVIAPIWKRFLSTYPDVQLELRVDEAAMDIVANGFDAGFGVRDQLSADMIAVRVIGPVKVAVVGAPSYFAENPPPQTPHELSRHDCIQFLRPLDDTVEKWSFKRDGTSSEMVTTGRLTVNDPELAVRGAVDGLGVAYSFEALADPFLRSGQLVRVLEDWSPCLDGLFLYYPGHRQVPAALRAFIDMIRQADVMAGFAAVEPLACQ